LVDRYPLVFGELLNGNAGGKHLIGYLARARDIIYINNIVLIV
jgi:hypothetical protein